MEKIDPSYLKAVEKKMKKQGRSENEIARQLGEIQGIPETIHLKSSDLKPKKNAGPVSN